ncbi:MipA/OmpV family protein [Marinivivus vitaminiproducens]|uniref:MipA/OmpV family protein n=1 Tax=Marinivivus vitaminiproducens TaxID=3035935 RepID=UPI0027A04457|nr:MipA/OmpV family protein [Geminicoccaceae bacterium SCSIO 64248]
MAVLGSAFATLPVCAQETSSSDDWSFAVGGGAAIKPEFEGSEDYEIIPIPALRAERGPYYVSLDAYTLRANLVPSEVFNAGPIVNYRPKRGSADNNAVDDLENVDPAVEVGAFGSMFLNGFILNGSVSHDVANGHDGLLATAGTGFGFPVGEDIGVSAVISTTYASGNYMSTYFGIDNDNAARSGLDEYDADGGFKDVGLTLTARYTFSPSLAVTGSTSFTRLIGDAADSPIVDDEGSENQFTGAVTLVYMF